MIIKNINFDEEFISLLKEKLESLEIPQKKLKIEEEYSDDYYKLMSRIESMFSEYVDSIDEDVQPDLFKLIYDFLFERSKKVHSHTLFAESSALRSLIMQQQEVKFAGKYFRKCLSMMLDEITRDPKLMNYRLKDRSDDDLQIPSQDQLVKILGNATGKTRAIIAFLSITGLNVNEMINIKIRDFDIASTSDEVKIKIQSSSTEKRVHLTRAFLMYILMSFHGTCDIKAFDDEEYLFVSRQGKQLERNNVYMMIKRAGKNSKMDDLKSKAFNMLYEEIIRGKNPEVEELFKKNQDLFRVKKLEKFKGSLVDFQKAMQLSRKNFEVQSKKKEDE